MQLQQKAWEINPLYLNHEGKYHTPETLVYAPTRGKAKSEILSKVYCDDLKDYLGDEINYLNLRIKRAKGADKYLINGEVKPFWQIELDRRTKERDDEVDRIVRENPKGMAYILKGGYYYRPNRSGYTEHLISAGVYTVQEAASCIKKCSIGDNMRLILIDPKEHNAKLNKTIEDIQSRIIKI